MFTIDKGIVVPEKTANGKAPIYPFKKMQKGDSFFVPDSAEMEKVKGAAYSYARFHNLEFSARKETGGMRIWRIS
jgi:hypothetical protein